MKSTPYDRFFKKLFIAILFTLRVFARNLLLSAYILNFIKFKDRKHLIKDLLQILFMKQKICYHVVLSFFFVVFFYFFLMLELLSSVSREYIFHAEMENIKRCKKGIDKSEL